MLRVKDSNERLRIKCSVQITRVLLLVQPSATAAAAKGCVACDSEGNQTHAIYRYLMKWQFDRIITSLENIEWLVKL